MNPTKAQLKALRGIAANTGPSGWATWWPVNVSDISLKRCTDAGWLKREVFGVFVTFRLTDEGRKALEEVGNRD